MRFYPHFSLDMDRSPGFGSIACNCFVLLTLAFTSATDLKSLTLLHTIARRTVLQKVRGCTRMVLPQFVNTGFQVLFHSPPGVLFTFPSQYCSTIGHQVVFRLGGWSPRIPCGFLVSARTLDSGRFARVSITGLSPSSAGLPIPFFYAYSCFFRSVPRAYCYPRFGLFRFRSPLLTKSRLMSLPPPT